MSIKNPNQLVNEFKKSGEFDRFRRELLTQFQQSEAMESFMARVEDVAQKRLDTDSKLHYMPSESIHRELLQELDRYPILERALVDMHALSDPALSANIQKSALTILRQDRGESAKDGDEETALAPIPPVQESDVPSASLEPAPTLPKVNGIERAQSVVSEQPPEEMDITTD